MVSCARHEPCIGGIAGKAVYLAVDEDGARLVRIGGAASAPALGVVHAHTFHFDAQVPYMIGIYYLLAYEGGEIHPGDDMHDAHYRWWSIKELSAANIRLHPSTHLWMLQRAVVLYRCWKDQPAVPLQAALGS